MVILYGSASMNFLRITAESIGTNSMLVDWKVRRCKLFLTTGAGLQLCAGLRLGNSCVSLLSLIPVKVAWKLRGGEIRLLDSRWSRTGST
jgi:hypothetical protein